MKLPHSLSKLPRTFFQVVHVNMKLKLLFYFQILNLSLSVPVNVIHEEEFPIGKTATILCKSNDEDHLFYAWELPNRDLIIPPNDYDAKKREYEVLEGKLIIKNISKDDEGEYVCISKGVRKEDINLHKIKVIVRENWEKVYEQDRSLNFFRVVVVTGSAFLIIGVIYYIYRVISDKHRLPRYLETDDDDSGEELFSAPSTSRENEMSTITPANEYSKLTSDK